MTSIENMSQLEEYYTYRYNEAQRFDANLKGQLERQRMREFLARYLPSPPAAIADIGGGPGAHATWLQDEGYDVRLLDPLERHVAEARAAGVNAVRGESRHLPWDDNSFDTVLMGGPMYHLRTEFSRVAALREAARVLRPGGFIFVTAINRAANLVGSALANTFQDRRAIVRQILAEGYSPDNDRLVMTTYHSVPQLRSELSKVATNIDIHGLTGPGGWLAVLIDAHFADQALPSTLVTPDPLQTALECSRVADQYPELVHTSSLLLAVARCG
ncbi:class I SAM-dependent methyltransferase [Kribbella italica]|uniref:Ubiquinone/menaquinone biosynthesis C-methylase UbiE n=1 Tax=Kribbella italica TaxID=1540520 RepID=A0A7W9J192_9ACTN|nr:ubiquinone/menaquinone biosynthesis C-methylase UbiE [Kribbella italica]